MLAKKKLIFFLKFLNCSNFFYHYYFNLSLYNYFYFLKNDRIVFPNFKFENIILFFNKYTEWNSIYYLSRPLFFKVADKVVFFVQFDLFLKSFYNLLHVIFYFLKNDFFFYIFSIRNVMENYFNLFAYNYNYFSHGVYSLIYNVSSRSLKYYSTYVGLYELSEKFNIRLVMLIEENLYRHSILLLKRMNFTVIGLISSNMYSNHIDYFLLVKKIDILIVSLFFNFSNIFYFNYIRQKYYNKLLKVNYLFYKFLMLNKH